MRLLAFLESPLRISASQMLIRNGGYTRRAAIRPNKHQAIPREHTMGSLHQTDKMPSSAFCPFCAVTSMSGLRPVQPMIQVGTFNYLFR